MRTIQLAPSDFAYLLEECPRCWWLKTRKLAPMREPMPKVFGSVDRAMRAALAPNPDRPELEEWSHAMRALGVPVVSVVPIDYVRSAPIVFDDLGVTVVIGGYIDKAYVLDHGFAVIDFKLTDIAGAQKVARFSAQLHSYQWCIEKPCKGAGREVTDLGIVAMSPGGMKLAPPEDGGVRCAFSGVLTHTAIDIDRAKFYDDVLRKAAELAAPDELPRPGEGCARCFSVAEVLKYMADTDKRKSAQQEAA